MYFLVKVREFNLAELGVGAGQSWKSREGKLIAGYCFMVAPAWINEDCVVCL